MEHFYQFIGEKWFTYPELYKQAVDEFANEYNKLIHSSDSCWITSK